MLEVKSLVSKIVRNFKILVTKENEDPPLVSELVLRSMNGINLSFKARTG